MNPTINPMTLNQFEAHRSSMFAIAYRMLGSATDAEDILQEAYLRYCAAASDQIVSHKAFLNTMVIRLCLNQLALARNQREQYIGTWLPEPILTETNPTLLPGQQLELHESLSIAFLALLEQLTPGERAVFLLREVFSYEYAEIATMIGSSEAACRQMFSRAKKHLADHRPRFEPNPETHRELLARFIQATRSGNLEALVKLLVNEVTLWTDGGGKARGATLHPISGQEAVARFLLHSVKLAEGDFRVDVANVNNQPSVIIHTQGKVQVVLSITTINGQITEIYALGNPDKLTWLAGRIQNDEEATE